jgi:hypothetical protein
VQALPLAVQALLGTPGDRAHPRILTACRRYNVTPSRGSRR